MAPRYRLSTLSLFALVLTLTTAYGDSPVRSVPLGLPQDVSTLAAVERDVVVEPGAATARELVAFSLEAEWVDLYPSPLQGYDHIEVGGLPLHGSPGAPMLPVKTIVVSLPKNAVVHGARLVSGTIAPIEGEILPVPVPTPAAWTAFDESRPEYRPDAELYGGNRLLPGSFVGLDSGSDRTRSYAFVRVHPVQWDPAEPKAYVLTDGVIEVSYTRVDPAPSFRGPSRTDAVSVILCPQVLQAQADDLAAFHEMQDGMDTEVVTTEWISETYPEAPDPREPGYVQEQPSFIQDYDFSLAKKIIAYLRDQDAHPNLTHVTVFGDAGLVPPSYYVDFGNNWANWPPTDMFYASPGYDDYPDFCVGRLPVSSVTEASRFLEKISMWVGSHDWETFSRLAVTGGDPFDSHEYYGELICVDPINRGYLTGHQVEKFFGTDEQFTVPEVLPLLSQGERGFIHQILHGSGDAIWFDDGTSINSQELELLHHQPGLPIVTCIACYCGAWDSDLIPGMGFGVSYGEGVVQSGAGGIAYIGGARSNMGVPSYYIDQGNLIIDREWYMADLLTRMYHSYHLGTATLGDLYTAGIDSFVVNNLMSEPYNRWTLFCSVLLGDPALHLLAQVPGDSYAVPFITGQEPDCYNALGFPSFQVAPGEAIVQTAVTASPSVAVKMVRAEDLGPAIWWDSLPAAPFDFPYEPEAGSHFTLARVSTEDAKEGWRYFHSTTGLIAVDGSVSDWEAAGIEPLATDPEDFEPSAWDVHHLYVANDMGYWYFGFDAHPYNADVAYGLALDCRDGGYIGEEGTDQDALDNWITFSAEHPVDFEIYSIGNQGAIYEWEDGWPAAWNDTPLWDVGGASSFGVSENGFVEFAVPKAYLGDPAAVSVILFSTGEGRFFGSDSPDCQPAQDACPSDPATFTSPHWGQPNANTLSAFITAESGLQRVVPPTGASAFGLRGAAPNPFSGSTEIVFTLPAGYALDGLKVFDTSGRLMADLLAVAESPARSGALAWDGRDLRGRMCPRGVYHCRLESAGMTRTTRLILVR